MTADELSAALAPRRTTLYRIVMAPKTFFLFRLLFIANQEPRPTRQALRYTRLVTFRRRPVLPSV